MAYLATFGLIAAAMIASPASGRAMFDAAPVEDATLAAARGASLPSSSLTIGQLVGVQDDVARREFALIGSVSSIEMDNWWAETGQTLISANR